MGVYSYGAVAVASVAVGTVIGVGTALAAIRVMEMQRHVAPLVWGAAVPAVSDQVRR